MISDNPNVSLGIVVCSVYTRRIALMDAYYMKRKDILAYSPVDFNYLETLGKTFIFPVRYYRYFQEIIFNNAPVRRIAFTINTNSAFTGSYAGNPFWYQIFDLRQNGKLRRRQPIVDFYTAESCRLYVATTKAINFQDEITSISFDNFKDHHVLMLDLNSTQDATDIFYYPELFGKPLRLALIFIFSLEHVTELIVLEGQMSLVAVDKFGVFGKKN